MRICFALLFATLLGCGGGGGNNPLDKLVKPLFSDAGLKAQTASDTELCRRMFVDLIGRFPTQSEIQEDCEGRSAGQMADILQATPEYVLTSQRTWADRFGTNDIVVDWRYLQDLYAQVEALHTDELDYAEFATIALSHPGFIMQELDPVDRTRRSFEAFLGRPATDAEAYDLSALYRPWLPQPEQDPDFSYAARNAAMIVPAFCQPLTDCSSSLLGGGSLDFGGPATGFDLIRYDDATPEQLEIVREPGRVFVRQPFFWEAAADEILNRLLGWSDGGRFPREPGIVLPEVRQALADFLEDTGSYVRAERLVLASLLYRQSAVVEPAAEGEPEPPVWASGPVKYTQAEAILDSVLRMVGEDLGTCDPRYSDNFSYSILVDAGTMIGMTTQQIQADIDRLHSLQGHRSPLVLDQGTDLAFPNFVFPFLARMIGGCPGFQATRTDASGGLSYAFSQESLAELACTAFSDALVAIGTTQLEPNVTFQFRELYGRDPDPEELQAFTTAFANCTGDECNNNGMAAGVCVALLGSAEIVMH